MQPKIEFPESLLNGRPAPPPITLDELQALPIYKELLFFKSRYSKKNDSLVISNIYGTNIYIKKDIIGVGRGPLNLKIPQPTWESLLVSLSLHFFARATRSSKDGTRPSYKELSEIWELDKESDTTIYYNYDFIIKNNIKGRNDLKEAIQIRILLNSIYRKIENRTVFNFLIDILSLDFILSLKDTNF